MQKRVFTVAALAAFFAANGAQAAPWSFDPERYLASWSDEARCSAGVAHASLAHEPEMTGSVAAQPTDDDPSEAAEAL
ncbi:MAG TPA: hypothetical protein VEY05_13160 [Beijerinckiaceae bacterium]|jgi:hypothetical protein|nr:hypothetical protein [Beijerinckiaceae bacterium]